MAEVATEETNDWRGELAYPNSTQRRDRNSHWRVENSRNTRQWREVHSDAQAHQAEARSAQEENGSQDAWTGHGPHERHSVQGRLPGRNQAEATCLPVGARCQCEVRSGGELTEV